MNWRDAFISQARSDNAVRKLLNAQNASYCHQLHYLQMTAEKLAKGFQTPSTSKDPPEFTHSAIVRFLRVLKGSPEVRMRLGYSSAIAFSSYIDSLLPVAKDVEQLAPNFAGSTRPNPEYPWRPQPGQDVIVPADFGFPRLQPHDVKIVQLIRFIEQLLHLNL